MPQKLSIWTIYFSPSDFMGMYVARRFEMEVATDDVDIFETLDEARLWVRGQAEKHGQASGYCVLREEFDHPTVVESWL